MKTQLITILLLTFACLFTSSILAEPESAIEQLKDAKDASANAANAKNLGEAKIKAGGQFDYDYDRPKSTPEIKDAPELGKPEKVDQ